MRDTDDETVKIEILRGMWAARPTELRKTEHVESYRESMKRMYPNLLPSGDEDSGDTLRKVLEGLIVWPDQPDQSHLGRCSANEELGFHPQKMREDRSAS